MYYSPSAVRPITKLLKSKHSIKSIKCPRDAPSCSDANDWKYDKNDEINQLKFKKQSRQHPKYSEFTRTNYPKVFSSPIYLKQHEAGTERKKHAVFISKWTNELFVYTWKSSVNQSFRYECTRHSATYSLTQSHTITITEMNRRNAVRFVLFNFCEIRIKWMVERALAISHHWIVFERHIKILATMRLNISA